MSQPATATLWAAPLWAATAGFLLLFTIAMHFYAPGNAAFGAQAAGGTLALLTQLLITFGLSAAALVLIVAVVYAARAKNPAPATRAPSFKAAATADFLQQAYQPQPAAPLRGYRPAEAPKKAPAWATPSARINKTEPAAASRPAEPVFTQQTRQQPPARPLPSLVPTPLALQAENLLKQAHTIPNFATTPLPGQRRVLVKLAENFVPAPQRGAALALAVFRLRSPAHPA